MTPVSGAGFRLAVLNPAGRDPEQDFANPSGPTESAHAPINFHAYAACTGGIFFRDAARAEAAGLPVLLLLRGDLKASERALQSLQKAGCAVVVSLKETGLHQIAQQLSDPARLARFVRIIEKAHGCLAPTREAADFYRHVRQRDAAVEFIPTPYPLHEPEWDFSIPTERRAGIFVGTREWDVPSRNHAAALFAARRISDRTGARVTVFNVAGRTGERLLTQIGFAPERLRVVNRSVCYTAYLRTVAEHKLVLELDTSFVPGQVAGDALLCRLPCVGGNGAVDQLGHPTTCGAGRSTGELVEIATRLLADSAYYDQTVADSQRVAQQHLSFAAAATRLAQFFASVGSR